MAVSIVESKTRVSPMSAPEKAWLLQLVEDEPVVLNTETNLKMVALKSHAWDRIDFQFNSKNLGPKRTKKQLQKAWERLKTKSRQLRQFRIDVNNTEGPDDHKEEEKVLSFIQSEVNESGSDFDDNAFPAEANQYSCVQQSVTVEVDPDELVPFSLPETFLSETQRPSSDTVDVTDSTPFTVHEKVSATTRKRRMVRDSLYDEDTYACSEKMENLTEENREMRKKLADKRLTLLKLQKEEHEFRLKEAVFRYREAELRHQLAQENLEEARQHRILKKEEDQKNREINENILKNKLIEAQLNRKIAEAKAKEIPDNVKLTLKPRSCTTLNLPWCRPVLKKKIPYHQHMQSRLAAHQRQIQVEVPNPRPCEGQVEVIDRQPRLHQETEPHGKNKQDDNLSIEPFDRHIPAVEEESASSDTVAEILIKEEPIDDPLEIKKE